MITQLFQVFPLPNFSMFRTYGSGTCVLKAVLDTYLLLQTLYSFFSILLCTQGGNLNGLD